MKDYKEEHEQKAVEFAVQATEVANGIIDFLNASGVDMNVGVFAAGMAFSAGAGAMGLGLPQTIDIVRLIYKKGHPDYEADE
jgi:hypothetical protein